MKKYFNRLMKSQEFYILIVIIIISLFIQFQSGLFFTANNLVDLMRAIIVPGILALGVMMVIISGGFDVSFCAVAMLSVFITIYTLLAIDYNGNAVLAFIMSGVIGIMLGLVNGVIVAKFRIPTLIVTLGTSSIYLGILHGIFKAVECNLPKPLVELSKKELFTVYNEKTGMSSTLPLVFLIFIALIFVVWFIMNKTMTGRGIYAIGGNINSAKCVGFNVFRIQLFLYGFIGFLASIAGMTRVTLMKLFHPNALAGIELNIMAMVVLGGTRVSGGVGTVKGTILGVVLFTMISYSLSLMGIPTYWQKLFTGILILLGTGFSAYQVLRIQSKISSKPLE